MNGVDNLFAALREAGEQRLAETRAHRARMREAANARRRARYAARKAAGTLPARRRPIPEPEPDYEPECRCHVVPMPPCSFCADGAGTEEDQ